MSTRNEWQRLRGINRSRDIRLGLQARMADPLWLLARQWQFGEFQGEDASSPVKVQVQHGSIPVTQFQGNSGNGTLTKPEELDRNVILETVAERESVVGGPSALRLSGEAGIQFLRKVPVSKRKPILDALQKRFPLPEPESANPGKKKLLGILVLGSFDARRFIKLQNDKLAIIADEASVNQNEFSKAFKSWSNYYNNRFSETKEPLSNWRKDRLEYRFSITASKGEKISAELIADEYAGGRLDWHQFDFNKRGSKGQESPPPRNSDLWLIPTPVRYAGMPADRFWNFEDAKVFFGGIGAGPTDLAQIILTEFATVYSNDWFMLPVPVETGTLTRVSEVTVFDSFGDKKKIKPLAVNDGPKRVWRFFEINGDPSAEHGFSPWLFVPRSILGGLEDRPVEQVTFSRDEMANLAWGIEETVEGDSGHRVSRRKTWAVHRSQVKSYLGSHEKQQDDAEVSGDETEDDRWIYRLLSVVPPYWVPFVPELKKGRTTNRLLRGRMGEWDLLGDLKEKLAGAQGRILAPHAPMTIQEEEIQRGGIQVTRSYQAARDTQGNLIIWVGRRKRPASGNRSSGRETDKIEH